MTTETLKSLVQREIDGPVTATFACCSACVLIVCAAGFIAGGISLALFLSPIGLFAGGSLALRFSQHPAMCKWRCVGNWIAAHVGRVVFLYALPLWIVIAWKDGILFTIVLMGGVSALILFGISGSIALLVAASHLASVRKTVSGARGG